MALLEATLQALKTTNNDRAISILTQTFYKSYFKADPDLSIWLAHARDYWLPQTLDCLKDDSKFILEISEQIHTSLGLYIFLVSLERKSNLAILSDL